MQLVEHRPQQPLRPQQPQFGVRLVRIERELMVVPFVFGIVAEIGFGDDDMVGVLFVLGQFFDCRPHAVGFDHQK